MTNDFHEREDDDARPRQGAGGGDGARCGDGAGQIEAHGGGGEHPDRDPVEEAERGDAGKDRGDGGGDVEKLHDALIEQLLAQQSKLLACAAADAFRVPEPLPPVEWLERHVAEIPFSPLPGAFRCANSPMLREIIEAICSPSVRTVSIIAAVQTGKTLAAELSAAYVVANEPGPILWLTAKDDDAKTEGESRLLPLFEHCRPVSDLFPADPDKKRLTSVFFANGATLWIRGANNRRNLQSRTIRWLFGDECWLWPPGRLTEAKSRVAAYGRRGKCVFFSQGSLEGDDCDRQFRAGTRREWTFVCPRCGQRQPFLWENIQWDGEAKTPEGAYDFPRLRASVRLRCPHCGEEFPNGAATRAALAAHGAFARTNHAASPENESFHWNALATTDWGQLAEEYLRAKAEARKGRFEDLAAFYQQKLALAWKDEDASVSDEVFDNADEGFLMGEDDWDGEGVALRGERRFIPFAQFRSRADFDDAAPRLRFLTIDVQDGYFVYVVRRWAPEGGVSRLLWCGIAQTFGDLEDVREKFSVHKSFVFIDAGFATQRVAEWCAATGATAFQGDRAGRAVWRHADGTFRAYSPRRSLRAGNAPRAANAFFFSPLACKDKLTDLRRAGPSAWALPRDVPGDYLKQMGAECRSAVNGKPMWIKRGSRENHYWDCETMQIAAAFVTKIL